MRKIELKLVTSNTSEEIRKKCGVTGPIQKGVMVLGPSIGKSFTFYRDDGANFHTSEVKHLEFVDNTNIKMKTKNSEYILTIGEEIEPS